LTTALHADDGMSVEVHFRRFASSLELTNEETRKAATIQNQIREVLEARQDISRAELSGSYDRKTKIRPLHDIDILVVFDPSVAYDGRGTMIKPRQFLSEIGKSVPALRKKIPRVGNSRFQDRSLNIAVDGIGFDLVPAFELQRGGYFIPNRKQQEWIPTNPLKFAERLTPLNQSDYFGERLVPFIKMVKSWAKQSAPELKSYLIEVLILKCMHGIESYSDACGTFFFLVSKEILGSVVDPMTGREVNELVPLQRMGLMRKLRRNLSLTLDAQVAEKLGRSSQVSAKFFSQIFGPKFPLTIKA
jgi:predicted nucleotidyltransferase